MSDLAEALRFHRDKAIKRWVDYTLSTYASSRFFKNQGDKFANPVGGIVKDSLSTLFDLISHNEDAKEFVKPLDAIVKLRAVQEFAPSQAVAPIHAIKHILREQLEADKDRREFVNQLYDFEFAVDMAVLAAFDLYMQSREQLYNVRINEIRSGRSVLADSKCPSSLAKDNVQESIK